MSLDLHDALFAPRSTKPFAFCPFTLRAVALAAVNAIKQVTISTMRLLGIDVGDRCGIAFRILRTRQDVEMLRVHARTITADVVYHEALWDRSTGKPKRRAMRFTRRPSEKEQAVSIFIEPTTPNDAVPLEAALDLKSLPFLIGRAFAHITSPAQTVNMARIVSGPQ